MPLRCERMYNVGVKHVISYHITVPGLDLGLGRFSQTVPLTGVIDIDLGVLARS